MKNFFCAIAAISILLSAHIVKAQEDSTGNAKKRKQHQLVISSNGILLKKTDSAYVQAGVLDSNSDKPVSNRLFSINSGPVDVGLNLLADNTNYSSASVRNFLRVPAQYQNKSLFDLRTAKSVNVNVYPFMVSCYAVRKHNFRLYISSGLGLQLYNFRYQSQVTYTKNPTGVILDTTVGLRKNKLALDYLNVPLMLTFKSRISKKDWLVYGAGITEGYLICSWMKQEELGGKKMKTYDAFGLSSTNTCLSAEIGLDNSFRFYFTYQLGSMFGNGIDQHPICFGIRFSGI